VKPRRSSKRKRDQAPLDPLFRPEIPRLLAGRNANRHLYAYLLDRNPQHVLNAWGEYRKARVKPPETMFRNLDHVLSKLEHGASRRPRANTLRDLEVCWCACLLCRKKTLPAKVSGSVITRLARHFGLGENHIRVVLSRMRRDLADPWPARRSFSRPT
jgi:hypothetical protein